MAYSWNDPDSQDLWTLTVEELALLPGMTDKGRIGFAVQLKFMELHGRFPERHDELDPNAVQWLAMQLHTTAECYPRMSLAAGRGNDIGVPSAPFLISGLQMELTYND